MLAIVDYGMGNLRSVQKAFELQGVKADIVRTPEEVQRAGRLVVPGVGAFRDAIAVLKETGLAGAIQDFVKTGKPMLGICLGLQLLMEVGYEDGEHEGLGIVAGVCKKFTVDQAPWRLKVPHMGWNSLQWDKRGSGGGNGGGMPLFKDLEPGCYAYFVHSYHVVPKDPGVIGCTADYGEPFVAALWKDNLVATQFHPEKSQKVGGIMLRNFAQM